MKESIGDNNNRLAAIMNNTMIVVLGILSSCLVTLFSIYFPFWLAPEAARKTYFMAFYSYTEPELHHFDTTIWTYGTNYVIALTMFYWCYSLTLPKYNTAASTTSTTEKTGNTDHINNSCIGHRRLRNRIWVLLLGYATSVICGAIAHQFYPTREDRNTWHFRLLWTVCVGKVVFASLSMGCIGSEIARQCHFQHQMYHAIPGNLFVCPELFWVAFGLCTTVMCIFGFFSYQRPACDLFIAGITQFPSSFYLIAILWKQESPYIRPAYQYMGMAAFILNAPLLPLYPLLVQYTSWTLAGVNTFLHTWLWTTWSMQAVSLRHVQRAIAQSEQRPTMAVPKVAGKKAKAS